jgi:hypothetical protein
MRFVVLVVLVGCSYRATFDDCEVACSSGVCPDGLSCGSEGLCRVAGGRASCADVRVPVTLRQTNDATIGTGLGSACRMGAATADNSWYRLFLLDELAGDFHAQMVTLAIQEASAGAEVTVSVGTYEAVVDGALDLARIADLATTSVVVPEHTADTLLDVPLEAIVPRGAQLLVEVSPRDFTGSDTYFYLGATAAGDVVPAYWRSAACSQAAPLPSQLGPIAAYIIEVTGTVE